MAEEADMAYRGNKQGTPTIDRYLLAVGLLGSLLVFGFLAAHLRLIKTEFTVDNIALILLFAVIGCLLLPFLSRLKIGGMLEVELKRLGGEIREVKGTLLRGEVVQVQHGARFYIDNAGGRHLIPDDETERFLRGPKGTILVSREDVEPYPLTDPMDSVLSRKPLFLKPHVFVVLNRKRYHVTIDDLVDWGWPDEKDWQPVNLEDIRKYPSGR